MIYYENRYHLSGKEKCEDSLQRLKTLLVEAPIQISRCHFIWKQTHLDID